MTPSHEERMQKKLPVDGHIAAAQEERGRAASIPATVRANPPPPSVSSPAPSATACRPSPSCSSSRAARIPARKAFFRSQPGGAGMSAAKASPGKRRERERDPCRPCRLASRPAILPTRPSALVVLDEMTYVFKYGWPDLDEVLDRC